MEQHQHRGEPAGLLVRAKAEKDKTGQGNGRGIYSDIGDDTSWRHGVHEWSAGVCRHFSLYSVLTEQASAHPHTHNSS